MTCTRQRNECDFHSDYMYLNSNSRNDKPCGYFGDVPSLFQGELNGIFTWNSNRPWLGLWALFTLDAMDVERKENVDHINVAVIVRDPVPLPRIGKDLQSLSVNLMHIILDSIRTCLLKFLSKRQTSIYKQLLSIYKLTKNKPANLYLCWSLPSAVLSAG